MTSLRTDSRPLDADRLSANDLELGRSRPEVGKRSEIGPLASLLVAVGGVGVLLLLAAALINISYNAESWRTMWVFSPDEPYELRKVMRSLEEGRADPHSEFRYGYLYPGSGWAVGNLFAQFGAATDYRRIAITMRVISLLAWCGVLWLVFVILRRVGAPPEIAMLGALLTGSMTSLHARAYMAMPDLMQTVLVLAAAALVVRSPDRRSTLAAYFTAGLAFGVKYGGVFLTPFLAIPWLLAEARARTLDWRRILGVAVAGGLLFVTAYVMTNPYVVFSVPELRHDLAFERDHVGRGHEIDESPNPLVWFSVLGEVFPGTSGLLVVAGLAVGALLGLRAAREAGLLSMLRDGRRAPIIFLVSYTLLAFLVLFLTVRMRRPRYLFHILPFLCILSVYGWSSLAARLPRPTRLAVPLLGLVLTLPLTFATLRQASAVSHRYEHPYFRIGEILAERYPEGARVLADNYSYVGEEFPKTVFRCGFWEAHFEFLEPTVLVMNRTCTGRFSWKRHGTRFSDLDLVTSELDDASEVRAFQQEAFAAGSPWQIDHEEEDFVILSRRAEGLPEAPAEPTE